MLDGEDCVVLVADDDASFRNGLAEALGRYFRVICAHSFESAVSQLELENVRILVTDHAFGASGEPTGLDLLRFTSWAFPRIRRVAISAADPLTAVRFADLVLPKPWPERLPEVLRW